MEMTDNINILCEKIRMHTCSSCGGRYDNFTCIYCGQKNEELMHLEGELSSILGNVKSIDIDILLSLYSIRKYNIDIVNEILAKHNIDKYLVDRNNELQNKKDNYTDEDYKLLFYFVENDMFEKGSNINKLMGELIRDNLTLSTKDKLKLIKIFTSHIVNLSTKFKPHVNINNDNEEKVVGTSFYGYLEFNEKQIVEWLDSKNYIEILKTVFHECAHTLQKHNMKNVEIPNYYLLIETKEEIIRMFIDDYYEDNYMINSHEVEARLKGVYETITYLELSGIEVKNKEELLQEANRDRMLSAIEGRKLNGTIVNVHDIFDSLLPRLNNAFLVNYPPLKIEYKNENGIIVRKSKEDLDNDYKELSGYYKGGPEKEELDRLYSFLYERLNKEKTNHN